MPSFYSTQINLPDILIPDFIASKRYIDHDDLGVNGFDKGGPPHITVRYKINTDNIADIKSVVNQFFPFFVKLGNISSFPPSQFSDGDVPLILEVLAPQLHKLYDVISKKLPCHPSNFPYHPHITIAYLKPGRESAYVGKRYGVISGSEFIATNLVFMNTDGTEIPVV